MATKPVGHACIRENICARSDPKDLHQLRANDGHFHEARIEYARRAWADALCCECAGKDCKSAVKRDKINAGKEARQMPTEEPQAEETQFEETPVETAPAKAAKQPVVIDMSQPAPERIKQAAKGFGYSWSLEQLDLNEAVEAVTNAAKEAGGTFGTAKIEALLVKHDPAINWYAVRSIIEGLPDRFERVSKTKWKLAE